MNHTKRDPKNVTVYISGPMTGYPDLNFPAFYEAEGRLRAAGFEVVNPAAIEQPDKSWEACMRKDIAELMRADVVVTLPGWERSRGANLEVRLARELKMKVVELETILVTAEQRRDAGNAGDEDQEGCISACGG